MNSIQRHCSVPFVPVDVRGWWSQMSGHREVVGRGSPPSRMTLCSKIIIASPSCSSTTLKTRPGSLSRMFALPLLWRMWATRFLTRRTGRFVFRVLPLPSPVAEGQSRGWTSLEWNSWCLTHLSFLQISIFVNPSSVPYSVRYKLEPEEMEQLKGGNDNFRA